MASPRKYEDKNQKNGVGKFMFFSAMAILQVVVFFGVFYIGMWPFMMWVDLISRIFAFILSIIIYSQNKSGSVKTPWIIIILTLPIVGTFMYVYYGLSGSIRKMRFRFKAIDDTIKPYMPDESETMRRFTEKDPQTAGISQYLSRNTIYPVFANTKVTYYPDAVDALEAQIEALKTAKKFIFLEYFSIENARGWSGIAEVLEEKLKEGVEIRILYDDVGSLWFVDREFKRSLKEKGIDAQVFNPVRPIWKIFFNNRDHRKITVIDGKIGFTGGYNLADHYFNYRTRFGYWKDTGVKLEGDAVDGLTGAFLEMWSAAKKKDDIVPERDLVPYFRTPEMKAAETHGDEMSFVHPYADIPVGSEQVGEEVYIGIVNRAVSYVYFMTPYLIITDEMRHALLLAAKRGVDVRIITPGIPDKKLVFRLTRSYYHGLVTYGIRIYEYTPGFCHGKMCISDDLVATCGTTNLDFRSFYHHFENDCMFYNCEAVMDMKKDFEASFEVGTEVTMKYRTGKLANMKFLQMLLRILGPML